LITISSVLMCPHGGTVKGTPTAKVRVGGGPILTAGDTFSIAGCTLNISGAPHPCVTVEWVQPAMLCRAGSEALTAESVGLCKAADQAVQGTVMIQSTQTKVSGR
jgi:hypothetical protein